MTLCETARAGRIGRDERSTKERIVASLVVMWLALPLACAHAPTPAEIAPAEPSDAPSTDPLAEFIATNAAVQAVAAAAEREDLLGTRDPDLEDLEVAAQALGIGTIEELGRRLELVVDEAPMLLAALYRVRPASRRGDVAHWVAVTLVGLDGGELNEEQFRARADWEPDYVDDVVSLRRLHSRGELSRIAFPAAEGESDGRAVVVAPELAPETRPRIVPRRSTGYWPVFARPGDRAIGGMVQLEAESAIDWDDANILVRRPGSARVIEAPNIELPAFRMAEDGSLRPAGTAALEPDQLLDVLVTLPGTGTLVMVTEGLVVEIPWRQACCSVERDADVEWWVRLASGEFAGAWVLASTDAFALRPPRRPR